MIVTDGTSTVTVPVMALIVPPEIVTDGISAVRVPDIIALMVPPTMVAANTLLTVLTVAQQHTSGHE